jgi:hypothetical protein
MFVSRRWAGIDQVLAQQRAGLGDRGQRVADLVRDRGRHAPHGRELLGADAGLELTQVLQEHHAQALDATIGGAGEPRAHAHLARRAQGLRDRDLARLRGAPREGIARDRSQRHPGRVRAQRERQLELGQPLSEDRVGRRIGRVHLPLRIDHQHAFAERLDHQVVHQGMHLRRAPVALCQRFLAHQPPRELVRQQRHHEQAGAGQRGLHEAGGGFGLLLQPVPAGMRQQQQRDHGRGAQADRAAAQHRAHQHRQGEQRRVIDAAHLQQLKSAEDHQVDADGRQPGRAEAPHRRLEACVAGDQQGCNKIAAGQCDDDRLQGLPESEHQALEQQQHDGHEAARSHEAAPQAQQGRAVAADRLVERRPVGPGLGTRPEEGAHTPSPALRAAVLFAFGAAVRLIDGASVSASRPGGAPRCSTPCHRHRAPRPRRAGAARSARTAAWLAGARCCPVQAEEGAAACATAALRADPCARARPPPG